MSTGKAIVLAAVLVVAAAAAGIYWYATAYDTVAGRCDRGDLGACSYLAAQQAAQAAADQAARDAQAAMDDASREALGLCYLQVAGHDATIRVAGLNADFTCDLLRSHPIAGETWRATADPQLYSVICRLSWEGVGPKGEDAQTVTVLDSGGAFYGTQACSELATYD